MNLQHYSKADKSKLYYLASPYSHKNPFIRAYRYLAVDYAAAVLTDQGFRLLEPISMCHHKTVNYNMESGYEFWKVRDRGFIDVSDGVIVLTMPGWLRSIGVMDEIDHANDQDKPVYELPWLSIVNEQLRKEL
jgi:hypothetical protein